MPPPYIPLSYVHIFRNDADSLLYVPLINIFLNELRSIINLSPSVRPV